MDLRGIVVEGVAPRGVVVDGVEPLALEPLGGGAVAAAAGVLDVPTEAGARAALTAIAPPRVVATPKLAHPRTRRLRAAGWGRERRAMGATYGSEVKPR